MKIQSFISQAKNRQGQGKRDIMVFVSLGQAGREASARKPVLPFIKMPVFLVDIAEYGLHVVIGILEHHGIKTVPGVFFVTP